ncbi:hypothetical protein [Zhongshania marina]|nr:hypothetical protein [Marortus luteolus]
MKTVAVGSRKIPLCVAVIGSFVTVGIFSLAILYIIESDEISTSQRLAQQREALVQMTAEDTARMVAKNIVQHGRLKWSTLDVHVGELVRAISVREKEGDSSAFRDYLAENEAFNGDTPTLPVHVDLAKHGADGYTSVVYVLDQGKFIASRSSTAMASVAAITVITGLIMFYMGYGFSSKSSSSYREASGKLNLVEGFSKKLLTKVPREESQSMRRYMTLLALRELGQPLGSAADKIASAISDLDRGDIITTRKALVDGLSSFRQSSHIVNSLARIAPGRSVEDKPIYRWVKAKDVFSELHDSMFQCVQAGAPIGFTVTYEGGELDEMLVDVDVLPLAVSAGMSSIERYVREGYIKIVGAVEKDLLVVTVMVNGASFINEAGVISSAVDNAIGEGMEFVFSFARTIGASISVQSVHDRGIVFHVGVPAKTRVGFPLDDGAGGLDLNLVYPSVEEEAYSTFFHNQGQGGIKILVVDDDVDKMRDMATKMSFDDLRRSDVRVTFTSDPAEAIRQAEDVCYDSVVIRYGIKDLDALLFFSFLDESGHDYTATHKVLLAQSGEVPLQRVSMLNQMDVQIVNGDVSVMDIKNMVRKVSLRAVCSGIVNLAT